LRDCITVHDFSENYKCKELAELQSDYFQKLEASIHVTLIYKHALLELDGVESTNENPKVITEQCFVISDDDKHDQHFTHFVQKQVSEYLKSIS
jgi:hypothetical protein